MRTATGTSQGGTGFEIDRKSSHSQEERPLYVGKATRRLTDRCRSINTRPEFPMQRESSITAGIVMGALILLWHAVRIPVFAVLRLAEPLVRLVLSALGLLSIVMGLFYQFASSVPHRPSLILLGFGVGCGLTLLAYERLLRLFS